MIPVYTCDIHSVRTVENLQALIARMNVDKGWRPSTEPEDIHQVDSYRLLAEVMLIATEVAEVAEAVRSHHRDMTYLDTHTNTYHPNMIMGLDGQQVTCKPEGIPAELADVVIRCLDMADKFGINLMEAIKIKLLYNNSRSFRHGGKAA